MKNTSPAIFRLRRQNSKIMKKESLVEVLIPHIVHVAFSTALVVLTCEVLKKVNRIHKDVKVLEEPRGVLKLLRQIHEERKEERRK